jgi:hypothetical protein
MSLACASQLEFPGLYILRQYSSTTLAENILSFVVSTTLRGPGKEEHLIQPLAIIEVPSWLQFILALIRFRGQTL